MEAGPPSSSYYYDWYSAGFQLGVKDIMNLIDEWGQGVWQDCPLGS